MYGGGSYGEFSYGGYEFTPIDTSEWEAYLDAPVESRCLVLEIDALSLAVSDALSAAYGGAGYGALGYGGASSASSGGQVVQRFASQGYTSHDEDSPALTCYDPRITGEVTIERRIVGRAGIGGLARTDAQVVLNNEDGALDVLTRDYAIDGRQARIRIGRATDALASFGALFTGVVADRGTLSEKSLGLKLSDGMARLDVPLNPTTYAGTGGLEGGADLEGKPKPYAAGHSFNVPLPLVDSTLLIYQAHDGAISDVPYVWDRQIALAKGADYASEADLLATAPGAGEYRVWKAGGHIRLGSTPAGTVTADVLGDASGAGYVNKTGDIVLRILVNQAELFSTEIDPASFSNLNTAAPAEVGVWVGPEDRTCKQEIDRLLFNIGAFGGFDRTNAFSVGLVAAAAGAVVAATYTEADIRDIQQEPLPSEVEPVAWRTRVGWQKNYTVQVDVAELVTPARRTFAAQEVRIAKHEDSSVRSRHRLARDYLAGEGLFALEADADTEVDRQFDLWSTRRRLFRVTLKLPALMRELGQVVKLQCPRFGLDAGVAGRVLGHKVKGSDVQLLVLV